MDVELGEQQRRPSAAVVQQPQQQAAVPSGQRAGAGRAGGRGCRRVFETVVALVCVALLVGFSFFALVGLVFGIFDSSMFLT